MGRGSPGTSPELGAVMTKFRPPTCRALASETILIPSDTAGVELQLIHRCRADLTQYAPERTLVLVHGATFSSASLFDVAVGGASFMDM